MQRNLKDLQKLEDDIKRGKIESSHSVAQKITEFYV